MNETGKFCDIYGDTIQNRVIEYLMENQSIDIATGDMARELKISKPKAYEIMKEFEKRNYICKSRVIGKTQLYKLEKNNRIVKIFLRNFKECLNLVIDESDSSGNMDINGKETLIKNAGHGLSVKALGA
jgi:hypothetical protein